MPSRLHQAFLRSIASLDWEERILNGGSLIALIGVFLPWMSGEWLGVESVTYSGLSFFTSFIGMGVFALHAFILLSTLVPLAGGPTLLKKKFKDSVRLAASVQATILQLAALSVLMKITLEFSRMEVRFGIYVGLLGSIASTLYAFIRYQEHRKSATAEVFHHPEDSAAPAPDLSAFELAMTPPPPPPAPAPDEHPLALHEH